MSWRKKKLDQLGTVARGRSRHRPRDAEHLYGGLYPFIQTGDVKQADLYISSFTQTYSDAGLQQSKLWPAGTLCITIAANIAETAILGIDACFPDSVIGFIADPEQSDTRFVKYLFDATIKARARQFSQGATQDNLSQEKLLSLEFDVPSVHEQKQIADVLSGYDDLIEKNRRRMALLEESARLLYREWFVRLRFPGYEHTPIFDGVPKGWERTTLGDSITLNYGKALKAEVRVEGEYPVFGSSGIVGTHEKPLVQGPAIVLGRKGNVGSVYWSSKSFYPIDTVYFVKPESSSLYLFYALKHMHFISTDVAVPGLNRDFAYSRPLLRPPATLLHSFHEVVEPIHAQLDKLEEASQKLGSARDLMLPLLMSSQIGA